MSGPSTAEQLREPIRCEHCGSPAVERAGRVCVPHLSWCPRRPRPRRTTVLPRLDLERDALAREEDGRCEERADVDRGQTAIAGDVS